MMNSQLKSLTVRQLNFYVKSLLENDPRLAFCRVSGEITNFKRHFSSGHLYFTLSDNDASIKCVMFKGYADRCKMALKDGVKVILTGRVSIYEKDGGYQFYVEGIEEDGLGDKLLALKLLKDKLQKEGLFEAENKRKLVEFPKRIAVVTSGTGAALQDILNVIKRRYPVCEVVVCSASVQGELAVKELINVLDRVYSLADKIDTIIIGRGGGSSEDLDAFNDEALARKIYQSPIPVISAVGHETDFTICDLVADLRAPTPSAAAELCVPDYFEVLNTINSLKHRCAHKVDSIIDFDNTRLKAVLSRPCISSPLRIVDDKNFLLDALSDKVFLNLKNKFDRFNNDFCSLVSKIDALSPLKTMSRGFVFAQSKGKPINSVKNVEINDNITLNLIDGKINCKVKGVEK